MPRLIACCAILLTLLGCHKDEELASRPSQPPKPPPLTTANLRGVWGTGPNDVWAAGDKGTILHYDGQAWSLTPSGTEENLSSIYGTSATNVWVTGEKGTILHYDGKVWKEDAKDKDAILVNLWASGPNDAWAVGVDSEGEAAYLRRWDGTKWEGQDVPGSSSLWGVGGTGPQDVWMVGNDPHGQGLVLHGNGKHFDPEHGYKGGQARAVWCAGPKDVWVAPGQGNLWHWDGKTWTEDTAASGNWFRLGGSGTDDVWAAGGDGVTLHRKAGAWASPTTGVKQIMWSIWSPSPDLAWAVGNAAVVERWNGTAWSRPDLTAPTAHDH